VAERAERRPALAGIHRPGVFGASGENDPGVVLTERARLTLIHLAGRPSRAGFLAAASAALSLDLPLEPNMVARGAGLTVFALAPTRWLVESESIAPETLEARLANGLAGTGAVTDVSGGRMAVRVGGAGARALLAKDCPIDLHPRAFRPGTCAQSILADVSVLIHALADGEHFDLYGPRSYGVHLWEWLIHAAAEFGCRVMPQEPG
jgi:sarcosine oxidase subunit gamma